MEEMTDSEEAFGLEASSTMDPTSLQTHKGKPASQRRWDEDEDERADYLGKAKEALTYCLVTLTILAAALLIAAIRVWHLTRVTSANCNEIQVNYNKHSSFD